MPSLLPLLVVNSDEDVLDELIKDIEKLAIFVIHTAKTGIDAIQVLREYKIKCVVCEIELYDIDGWRLARMVRAGIFMCASDTPIILSTSTWCEHIAEVTTREFDVNALLSLADRAKLPNLLADCLSGNLPLQSQTQLLIIESDKKLALEAKDSLKTRFNVDIAFTHKEGLLQWRQSQHQIILLDCPDNENLFDESQYFIAQVLIENPNQPIVVIISEHTPQVAEQLLVLGAADFTYKPIDSIALNRICESALRREDFLISTKQFASKVNSLKEKEQDYKKIHQQHQNLLNNIPTIVMELDEAGHIVFVNPAWQNLTQYCVEETLKTSFINFVYGQSSAHKDSVENTLELIITGQLKQCELEIQINTKTSNHLWVSASFSGRYRLDKLIGITLSLDNITKRKQAEIKLVHLALRDTLTDLYNRHYFDNELSRISILAKREESQFSLLYIDLDHFKIINDTQGHHQGDMVLKEVASAVKTRLRKSDILCRIGGDEFAVLLSDTSVSNAEKIANDICQVVQSGHYQFGDQVYPISCSIGLTKIDGSAEAHEYLKQADIALYVAKGRGRDTVHIYTPEDNSSTEFSNSIQWLQKLQQAISQDKIVLHFQPICDIKNRRISHHEALVRIQMDGQLIYPNSFIPALERAEEMKQLDQNVLIKTIQTLRDYPKLQRVAINLSAQAFNDEDLLLLVKGTLEKYKVSARRIIFEITESASLNNLAATQRIIDQLTLLGCTFAIDDFGTGFSTFAYLKQIPAQSVKIDGSFVKDMKNNSIDLTLVSSIKDIANALGKKTVAEFVEDEATYLLAQRLGIDYAQGYFLAKPDCIETTLKFTEEYNSKQSRKDKYK